MPQELFEDGLRKRLFSSQYGHAASDMSDRNVGLTGSDYIFVGPRFAVIPEYFKVVGWRKSSPPKNQFAYIFAATLVETDRLSEALSALLRHASNSFQQNSNSLSAS